MTKAQQRQVERKGLVHGTSKRKGQCWEMGAKSIRLERAAGGGNRSPSAIYSCINIGGALPCASVAATPAEAAGLGRIPGRAGRRRRRVVSGGGGGGGVSDG